jgi:hypothetical protein
LISLFTSSNRPDIIETHRYRSCIKGHRYRNSRQITLAYNIIPIHTDSPSLCINPHNIHVAQPFCPP